MVCRKCGGNKAEEEFGLFTNNGVSHRRHVCQSCRSKQTDPDKKKKNNERWRSKKTGSYEITRRYGVSQEAYEEQLLKQHGVCAICGQPPKSTGRIRRLCVDHDHVTQRFRGLLCHACNYLLGRLEKLFKENPKLFETILLYLNPELSGVIITYLKQGG
jgi:protein-arginine kinase activator protein McsA